MGPLDHALCQPFVQELALQEQGDDSLGEAGTHPGQLHGREVDEPSLAVEASLKEQAMPVRVPPPGRATAPPSEFARTPKHDNDGGADGFPGGY